MPARGALERYLIPEGGKLSLDNIDQDEKALFLEGGKEDHLPYFDQLREQLQSLLSLIHI